MTSQTSGQSHATTTDVTAVTSHPSDADDAITMDELGLAARNHAMPLEALRYPITPAGLHYLLIHFDIPAVEVATWRLTVDGLVERPLTLSLAELQARPAVTLPVTLECAGNGRALFSPRAISQPWLNEAVGTAEWTGTPLAPLLKEAGLRSDAVEVVFTGLDRGIQGGEEHDYQRSLTLEDAQRDEVLLAYAMNGASLLPQHGFPLRLIVPGWYGMTHVKWLRGITAVAEPFHGYQQAGTYLFQTSDDDPGVPVTRMAPRSLMEPPGIPDFLSRTRFLRAGVCALHGRAWSGQGAIVRVEVSADGGHSWQDATLGEAPASSPYAWRPWAFDWQATPGAYDLCSRATDSAGNTQPLDAPWNVGGYMNNAVQRVTVTVS
jgi:DMSO/TMAO reductase YedYZ molybdopterin-dependent catalytic subunit